MLRRTQNGFIKENNEFLSVEDSYEIISTIKGLRACEAIKYIRKIYKGHDSVVKNLIDFFVLKKSIISEEAKYYLNKSWRS